MSQDDDRVWTWARGSRTNSEEGEIGGDDGNRTRVRGFAGTSGAYAHVRRCTRFVLDQRVTAAAVRRRCYQPLLPTPAARHGPGMLSRRFCVLFEVADRER